jgi:hypothetical protein
MSRQGAGFESATPEFKRTPDRLYVLDRRAVRYQPNARVFRVWQLREDFENGDH